MDAAVSDPLVGRVVDGRYAVSARIARGGMATVYLATDQRLQRDVALKVMHPHLAGDEQFVSRFIREARAAARLSHPGVVAVFDQGNDPGRDGNPPAVFLTMEHVPGRTLRDVLDDRGALTPREVGAMLTPVLQALAAAHQAGLVHRDVKPENVLVADDGRVKIGDFGLARAATTATSTTGVLIGTVAYLSPELVERGVADARSDVYAVGVMAFELLTGRQPFTGDIPLQIAYRHVHDEVPAPSSLAPGIPAVLDAVIHRATRRDPDERPRDAGALLTELTTALAGITGARLDDRADVVPTPPATTTTSPLHDQLHDQLDHGPGATLVVSDGSERRRMAGRGRRRTVWGLVAALVVAALAGAGWWYVEVGPGARAPVPTVAGQTEDRATQLLTAAGFTVTADPRYDDTVPEGEVIETDPAAGVQTPEGADVLVVVSRGPELFAVPELAGQTLTDAEQTLTSLGLAAGDVSEEYSTDVPAGTVIAAGTEAGERVRTGTEIALTVSLGRQPVTLPEVVGTTGEAAVAALEGAGLVAEVTEEYSDDIAAGVVISADPTSELFLGDTVTVTVSLGPPLVEVPNVADDKFEDAEAALRELGFEVERNGTRILDRVLEQRPSPGSQAPRGSTVRLFTV